MAELQPDRQSDLGPLLEQTASERSQLPRILLLTSRAESIRQQMSKQSAKDHSLSSVQILEIGSDYFRTIYEPLETDGPAS